MSVRNPASVKPLRNGNVAPVDVQPHAGNLLDLGKQFARSLRAQNKSPQTVEIYISALARLDDFLADVGMPRNAASLRREHVESFIQRLLKTRAPATAHNRYWALSAFFRWAGQEGLVKPNPMVNMTETDVPEALVPVIPKKDIQALFKACSGTSFQDRRDTAILYVLYDSGLRRAELVGLTLEDLDLDQGEAYVMGKGSRPARCPFGAKAGQALDRYLRERSKPRDAHLPNLFIGNQGKLTGSLGRGPDVLTLNPGQRGGLVPSACGASLPRLGIQ